ncbi:NAD(P)H-dependent flavin oxidoreductase [Mycolicibacterium austroafricanum]|uniref:NAD(P)H-dependent flavin oxidoreductase n=1 Tax=Mycolicibacterium austroafricanum TaxID=39687 RepID=UPI001CA32927|nr:nitronate monooxygenase [Mycolicibacterium austroafricanum]QZT61617.1 nitronate monooxygenase [Mycolicibacterium austroafricanum]
MNATSTPWSQAMGLAAPIVNAPMGGVAGGALAAAVSRAGGLGMIGIGSAGSADRLHTELSHVSDLDRPFGIGLISWAVAEQPRLLEAALAARPALLSVSFGDDWAWVRRAHDAGCITATQVADLDGAQCAADAGVDVLIARGAEAGGHGQPRVGTLPLLVEVLDRVAIPVLAAGGIASGRGLAAALAAGAAGGWLGTAFAACPESTLPDAAAQVMLAARNTDTVPTRVFDIALGYPWPPTIPERVLRNGFTDSWHGRESQLAADGGAVTALRAAIAADDYRLAPVNAGQGVSEVTAIEPAARVIQRLCDEAREVLQQ